MELRRPTRWRWVLWGLLAAGFALVSFHRVTSGVLANDLARSFDTTGTELGLLHASFFYIYAALQLPAGLLVDRYGSRSVASASASSKGALIPSTFSRKAAKAASRERIRWSMSAAVCSGLGVMRSRSVPRGTVG